MGDKKINAVFSIKLKKLRHDCGWTQGQLARKLGVNTQRISKYERGVIMPPTAMVLKIATVYNVSLDYLLRNETDTAVSKIKNQALLKRVEEIENLTENDQKVLTVLLDAFIKKRKFETMVKSGELEERQFYNI